jgi:O-methyltransferase
VLHDGEPIEIEVNGQLGLLLTSGDGQRAAIAFAVNGGRITRIACCDDESCLRILANCRRGLRPDRRPFAAEVVLDPAASPSFAYLLDLHMLVSLTGRERTVGEFRALFSAAGLEIARVTPAASLLPVLEARSARPSRAAGGVVDDSRDQIP